MKVEFVSSFVFLFFLTFYTTFRKTRTLETSSKAVVRIQKELQGILNTFEKPIALRQKK